MKAKHTAHPLVVGELMDRNRIDYLLLLHHSRGNALAKKTGATHYYC